MIVDFLTYSNRRQCCVDVRWIAAVYEEEFTLETGNLLLIIIDTWSGPRFIVSKEEGERVLAEWRKQHEEQDDDWWKRERDEDGNGGA